jgi:DNA replication protein DnaC
MKRIERTDLLILDDFGMQTFDSQARGILMDLIEDRHKKRSTLITSQVPVKGWYDSAKKPLPTPSSTELYTMP